MSDIKRINVNSNKATINPDYDAKLNHTDASLFTADALKHIAGYNPANGINLQNAVDVLAQKHSNLESKAAYIKNSYNNSDLDISDENGNVLARFSEGHFQTLDFDSSKDASEEGRGLMSATDKSKLNSIENGAEVNDVITDDVEGVDLNISDEEGNILIQAKDGHIKTKNFDSSKDATTEERGLMSAEDKEVLDESIEKLSTIEEGAEPNDVETDDTTVSDLDFSDEQDNVVMRLANGHIRTKNFDSSVVLTMADIDTLYNTLRVLNHPLHGKKVGFLGDSITYGYGLPSNIRETARYSSKFCTLVGCTEVNLGVNGTCIASNTINNKNDTRFVTRVTQANIGDLDFLFIFGGTNDFSYDSKPIGEHFSINQITPPSNLIGNTQLGPIADTDTFAGGLHDLILAIRAINPNLQMCFLTPLSRGRYLNGLSYKYDGITYRGARPNTEDSNKNGNYLYEYEDAIIDITKFYAIPSIRTISLFNNRATDDGTSDMFQADGDNIHLTVAGNEKLAKLLFNWTINNVII